MCLPMLTCQTLEPCSGFVCLGPPEVLVLTLSLTPLTLGSQPLMMAVPSPDGKGTTTAFSASCPEELEAQVDGRA